MAFSSSEKRTATLGDEYDEATRAALRAVLAELGASSRDSSWGIGGSQELETVIVTIGGRELRVEAETYIGLTVTGDEDLVSLVAGRVAQRLLVAK